MEVRLQPQDAYFAMQIFLAFAAVVVTVRTFVRWADGRLEKRIIEEIRQSTYQIQPTSNGGSSLRDLHDKVDRLVKDVGILKTAVLQLEGEMRLLEEDVEELR